MQQDFRLIILSRDGCELGGQVISELTLDVIQPGIGSLVDMFKINHATYASDMTAPGLGLALKGVRGFNGAKYKLFLDSKSGDVAETLAKIAKHWRGIFPEIMTINSLIAVKGFLEIKKQLPETSIALFSVPTDMSVEECKARYNGMTPTEKIFHDCEVYLELWEKFRQSEGLDLAKIYKKPFDLVVCSPRELDYLNDRGMGKYFKWITPCIRDYWMPKDHQVRTAGVLEALKKGAHKIIMCTQLTVGNPEEGISAEESQQLTLAEIDKFKKDFGVG